MKDKEYLKEEYHNGRHWGLNDRTKVIVDTFEKYVDKNATILELGCSSGRNLLALKERGFKNVTGLEMSDVAVRNIKDFPVIHKRYEESDHGEYDIIFSASFVQEFDDIPQEFKNTLEKTRKYFMVFGDLIRNEDAWNRMFSGWKLVEQFNDNAFSQPIRIYERVN